MILKNNKYKIGQKFDWTCFESGGIFEFVFENGYYGLYDCLLDNYIGIANLRHNCFYYTFINVADKSYKDCVKMIKFFEKNKPKKHKSIYSKIVSFIKQIF